MLAPVRGHNMEEFTTLYKYNAGETGPYWLLPLFVFLGGSIVALAFYRMTETIFNRKTLFGLIVAVVGLLAAVGTYNDQGTMQRIALNAVERKDASVIDGIVENFDSIPDSRVRGEEFDISGVFFKYHPDETFEGYHKTIERGGVIKGNGDSLRITYYTKLNQNYIVKIERKK